MIKPIITDQLFLQQVAVPARQEDLPLAQDLKDTLHAHRLECVGMAANMIGSNKAALIAMIGPLQVVMFNPTITEHHDQYQTSESCLSVPGESTTNRYRRITVKYRDDQWRIKSLSLTGYAAEIVQHEFDHLHGILI